MAIFNSYVSLPEGTPPKTLESKPAAPSQARVSRQKQRCAKFAPCGPGQTMFKGCECSTAVFIFFLGRIWITNAKTMPNYAKLGCVKLNIGSPVQPSTSLWNTRSPNGMKNVSQPFSDGRISIGEDAPSVEPFSCPE